MTIPTIAGQYVPPTRVKIPDDQPRWPDVEKAMVTVLDDILTGLEPHGYACVIPPPNWQELMQQGVAIVTVQRSGGNADRTDDQANVFISVTTPNRSDSWDVLGWLRPKLHDVSGVITNSDGTQALVKSIADMRGPQRDPSPKDDLGRVSAGFTVVTRLDR